MLLDVCLGTRTAWKIATVFAEAPGKALSRKDIQTLTKMGNKVLTKELRLMELCDLLTKSKLGKIHYYRLNLSNPFVGHILDLVHLEKRELNNLDLETMAILRELVYELTNTSLENLTKVVLFGSYAKRTYRRDSDIDVAIVMREKSTDDELLITERIGRLNKRFKREIQPHYYSAREFEEGRKRDALVKEIVKDGVILL